MPLVITSGRMTATFDGETWASTEWPRFAYLVQAGYGWVLKSDPSVPSGHPQRELVAAGIVAERMDGLVSGEPELEEPVPVPPGGRLWRGAPQPLL